MFPYICSQCGAPLDTGGRCGYCRTPFKPVVFEIGDKAKVIADGLDYGEEIGVVTGTVNDAEPYFPIELTFQRQPKPFIEYFAPGELLKA